MTRKLKDELHDALSGTMSDDGHKVKKNNDENLEHISAEEQEDDIKDHEFDGSADATIVKTDDDVLDSGHSEDW